MVGRLVAVAALAVIAGIALSLRDLVLPPQQGPLPIAILVLVGWLFALAALGWVSAQLVGRPVGVLVAPAAAVVAIGVALFAKQVRFPEAPLTGDGFEILIWVYALAGLLGAIVGLHPALRVRSTQHATTIGVGLLVFAGAVGAVPHVLVR